MKPKTLFISIVAFVAMILTAGSVSAQESYNWTKVKHSGWVRADSWSKPKSIRINWLPERDSIAYPYRRHTVALDFGKGVYSGFKFDYESNCRIIPESGSLPV